MCSSDLGAYLRQKRRELCSIFPQYATLNMVRLLAPDNPASEVLEERFRRAGLGLGVGIRWVHSEEELLRLLDLPPDFDVGCEEAR